MAVGGGDCVPEGIEEKTVAGRSQARLGRACTQHTEPREGGPVVPGSTQEVLGSRHLLPHLLNVTSGSGFVPAQNLSHVSGFSTWKTGQILNPETSSVLHTCLSTPRPSSHPSSEHVRGGLCFKTIHRLFSLQKHCRTHPRVSGVPAVRTQG